MTQEEIRFLRLAGTWKKRGRSIAVTLFDAPDAAARRAISDAAEALWGELSGLDVLSPA